MKRMLTIFAAATLAGCAAPAHNPGPGMDMSQMHEHMKRMQAEKAAHPAQDMQHRGEGHGKSD